MNNSKKFEQIFGFRQQVGEVIRRGCIVAQKVDETGSKG